VESKNARHVSKCATSIILEPEEDSMKRQAFTLVSLLSLLLVAGSAIAQTVHVRADIPFNFAVANKTFPAGTYDVSTVGNRDSKMLLLQSRDGSTSMIIGSNAAESSAPADKTKLVFNQYGNQYFLSQIWVNGETLGRQLQKSSREKEVGSELAQDRARGKVEIVASLQ
jgi:hypothetical protein